VKAWIYELLAMPDAEPTGRELIRATLAAVRQQGADLVEGRLTTTYLALWLKKEGFFPGRTLDRFIVYSGPALAGEELHTGEWYLTLADSGNA
jgi:hypothetical protein